MSVLLFLYILLCFSSKINSLRIPHFFRSLFTTTTHNDIKTNEVHGGEFSTEYNNQVSSINPTCRASTITTSVMPTIDVVSQFASAKPISIASEHSYVFGNTPRAQGPLLSKLLGWILRRIVQGRTEFVSGLFVNVAANSSIDVLRGRIGRLDVEFQKICFYDLYCSGGGRFTFEGLDLKMRRLLFKDKQPLQKSYKIFGDLLLTQADIVNSKFIRNLIQLLVDLIVKRAFAPMTYLQISEAQILRVDIRRVSLKGERLFAFGDIIFGNNSRAATPFEVSTGIGIRESGSVVFVRDIQVVLNPDSMFPVNIPILTTTPIDVDLGDNCNILSLILGEKHVWIRASSVISPMGAPSSNSTSLMIAEPKKALYRYDVAALFSSLLKVSGGLAVRWVKSKRGSIWNRYRSPR